MHSSISAQSTGASPRSRGWTLRQSRPGPGRAGFPALAGMDPYAPAARGCRSGFPALAGMDHISLSRLGSPAGLPRARGDGPGPTGWSAWRRRASPRSRGWTPVPSLRVGSGDGFPALAGMDRRPAGRCRRCRRLPRARGDGPVTTRGSIDMVKASPRSRGWTRPQIRPGRPVRGFPALAGMDQKGGRRPPERRGLPRARGDGPVIVPPSSRPGMASPRSRGWTRRVAPSARAAPGFPALAGMDHTYSSPPAARSGLPRARGDGPVTRSAGAGGVKASPRSRGWTLSGRLLLHAYAGFPALAGMDRGGADGPDAAPGLPRARGDGPQQHGIVLRHEGASPRSRGWTRASPGEGTMREGFPALAGMDPPPPRWRPSKAGLPRARGDGPGTASARAAGASASPRSRGWTSPRTTNTKVWEGFPALAGMDPSGGGDSAGRTGLPRARGDGPGKLAKSGEGGRASPRSRGWTRRAPGQRRRRGGFPALAGMDPPGAG